MQRILRILLLSAALLLSAGLSAQTVTREFNRTPLRAALEEIERQTGYSFLYKSDDIEASRTVTASFKGTPLRTVLETLLPEPYRYTINGKVISVSRQSAAQPRSSDKTKTLQGVVISATDNAPIPGAAVFVEGTTNGVLTDDAGNYTITVPDGTKALTFQILGYQTKVIPLKDEVLTRVVSLIEDTDVLADAVVVGFGVQKKESVVGAVQAIKPETLQYPSSSLSASFAGKIAGVISTQTSGEPGSDGANFWIRGISTFGSNTAPLIILDGVEINAQILNSIAPETIASFSVLKDATATALYGSRGANGVMIVVTKTGRDMEKMNVNVRFENGWSMPTSVMRMAGAVDYMEAFNEAMGTQYYPQEKIDGTRAGLNPYIYPDVDWYHTLFRDSVMNQNINMNVTGGSKKVDYFINASFYNDNGILKGYRNGTTTGLNYRKVVLQSNVGAQVTPTTRLSLKMNTQLHFKNGPSSDTNYLFRLTMTGNPAKFPVTFPSAPGETFTRYGSADHENGAGQVMVNPLATMCSGYSDLYYSYFTETLNLDQDLRFITPGLTLRGQASFYNYTRSQVNRTTVPHYYKLSDYYIDAGTGDYVIDSVPFGSATPQDYYSISTSRDGYREISLQASLEYTRKFADAHDVDALLVYHQKERQYNTPAANENSVLPYREQGLAGRLTYSYRDRYMMEANFGYNGSENFMRGHRFGFFPSIALGYNISNEPFFAPLRDVVSLLKIRASYGFSGNDALPSRFPYVTEVATNVSDVYWYVGEPDYAKLSGTKISLLGNEDATWEVSRKMNLGLELGLFNDLTLIADFFNEDRSGIFMQRRSMPSSAGFSEMMPFANIGKVNNRGFDASLEYNKAFSRDFTLSVRGSFTYAHNEIVDKDEPVGTQYFQSEIGHPIHSITGLVAQRLFLDEEEIAHSPVQTIQNEVLPGDIKYLDLDGNGRVDGNDFTVIGYPTVPEIVYGFGLSAKWKGFDASIFFQGQARVSIEMSGFHPFSGVGISGYGLQQWIMDSHWSPSNPDVHAEYPRLSVNWNLNNTQASSWWVRNGSFLRLKTAEVGYSFKSFRIYVSGSNLLTFTKFKYWDPGLGSGMGLSYPLQRTVNVGLQYNF